MPAYHVNVVTGEVEYRDFGPRQLHALAGVDRAAALLDRPIWREAAERGFASYLAFRQRLGAGWAFTGNPPLSDAILVAAVGHSDHPLQDHPEVTQAVRRLVDSVHPDGRISYYPQRLDVLQDFDFLPGAVLTALGQDAAHLDDLGPSRLGQVLRWNRNRFRRLRSWGMVGWQTQGWAAVHRIHPDSETAAFVFELADWSLDRQLATSGAFLEDLSPEEPSFNSGFISEGIAAAWKTAEAVGDSERAARYREACEGANRFMRRLVVAPEDTFMAAEPERVIGGVRLSPTSTLIRADSVSHWLHTLVSGAEMARQPPG